MPKFLGLQLDWVSVISFIVLLGGIFAFISSIISTSQTRADQINSLTQDVNQLKEAIPAIQRSLGRIEGSLGIKKHGE